MVTARIKRLAPAVVTVSLTDAKTGQTETLTCTPEHPLFVVGSGWVEAGSLGIGSSVVSRAGPALSVTSVTWQRNAQAEKLAGNTNTAGGYVVYNLTVEDDHTFFVGNTGGGTWVHNTCPGLHHFVPRSLGSDVPYGDNALTYLNQADHTAVHEGLNDALAGEAKTLSNGDVVNMYPRNGNPGSAVQSNFSPLERQRALTNFYQNFQIGKYFNLFQDEFNYTVSNGFWH